mgnify:CR=1 FL=1
MNYIEKVKEFHDAYGVETPQKPNVDNDELNELRQALIGEEFDELVEALIVADRRLTLDALCDLQYVLSGAVLALGFAPVFDEAFAEVHRSNMSKLGADGKPIRREDGKILKGPNYTPPDLGRFVE